METKLARISQLSKENPDMVFTSLGHLINQEMLKSCHTQMDGTKAVGIDGITKEEYGRNLEENLNALVERLKRKSYKPKPARLVEIPKDNGKLRPLSIYCYEDKLVQEALRRILEAVRQSVIKKKGNGNNFIAISSRVRFHSIVSAKYSCGFSNPQISPIIATDRYLDYFTTIIEDRLWQVLASPVFRWWNRSDLSMNAVRAA